MIPIDYKNKPIHKPEWLKVSLAKGQNSSHVYKTLRSNILHTVCEEALCPNRGECFTKGTATFMILGNICTRACRFCDVPSGIPSSYDPGEALRVACAAEEMKLKFVVITSVCRDDLPDEGAEAFVETIFAIKSRLPHVGIEVLIPDFSGKTGLIKKIIDANPDVIGHNIETVERLTQIVRAKATYNRTLNVVNFLAASGVKNVKSGIMVGLSESTEEVKKTLEDLYANGCRLLTIGQYLQPTRRHIPVYEYVPPEKFDQYYKIAKDIGFSAVASGPLVRSSYHAEHLQSLEESAPLD